MIAELDYITNGNVAITKEVLAAVKWPVFASVGEDADFNAVVYGMFKNTAYLNIALLLYRVQFSVYTPRGVRLLDERFRE